MGLEINPKEKTWCLPIVELALGHAGDLGTPLQLWRHQVPPQAVSGAFTGQQEYHSKAMYFNEVVSLLRMS